MELVSVYQLRSFVYIFFSSVLVKVECDGEIELILLYYFMGMW